MGVPDRQGHGAPLQPQDRPRGPRREERPPGRGQRRQDLRLRPRQERLRRPKLPEDVKREFRKKKNTFFNMLTFIFDGGFFVLKVDGSLHMFLNAKKIEQVQKFEGSLNPT